MELGSPSWEDKTLKLSETLSGRGGRAEGREEQRWLGFAVTTYSLAETRVLKQTRFVDFTFSNQISGCSV